MQFNSLEFAKLKFYNIKHIFLINYIILVLLIINTKYPQVPKLYLIIKKK